MIAVIASNRWDESRCFGLASVSFLSHSLPQILTKHPLGLEGSSETSRSSPNRCGHPRTDWRGDLRGGSLAGEDAVHRGPGRRGERDSRGRPRAGGSTRAPGAGGGGGAARGRAGRLARTCRRAGAGARWPRCPPRRAPCRKWLRRGPGAASAGRASSRGVAGQPEPEPERRERTSWPRGRPRVRGTPLLPPWTSCRGTSRTGRSASATAPCRARGTAGTR